MEVLRGSQEAVLTILEVLLYDPLHAWTISPAKAYNLQHRRDRAANSGDTVDLNTTTNGDIMDYAENNSKQNSTEFYNLVFKDPCLFVPSNACTSMFFVVIF